MSNSRIDMPTAAVSGSELLNQADKNLQAKNIPVEVTSTPQGDKLKLNHRELAIISQDGKDLKSLKQDTVRLTVLTQLSAAANSSSKLSATVQAHGEAISLPLPKGLVAYINANQISLVQLTNFASRPQGYPLGEVQITSNQLFFSNQQLVRLPSPAITDGQYLAKISMDNGQLILTLTPKLAEVNLLLMPLGKEVLLSNTSSPALYLSPLSSQALISKPELASAYHQLINSLARTSLTPESLNGLIRELTTSKATGALLPTLLSSKAAANPAQTSQTSIAPAPANQIAANPIAVNKGSSNQHFIQIPLSTAYTSNKTAAATGSLTGKSIVLTQTALAATGPTSGKLAQLKGTAQIDQSLLYQRVRAMFTEIRPAPNPQTNSQAISGEQGINKASGQLQSIPAALAQLSTLGKQAGAILPTGKSPDSEGLGQLSAGVNSKELNPKELNPKELSHRGLNLALNQLADKTVLAAKAPKGRNLLQLMQQLLPLAFPKPLSQLASPSTLKQELIDSLASIAAPATPVSNLGSITSHAGTIGVLFQLLLGRQVKNQSGAKTASQVQALQQLASNSQLLGLLEKSGGLESLGKLISNMSLYQQASSDTPQSTNWFFTLPYMIEHRHEELEGHFCQEEQEKASAPHWRLQLKFNLSQASLLINADVKQGQLNLSFTSENQSLLDNIDLKRQALEQKIQAIGLTPNKIHTQVSQVPASLLPGEHYLVKIKA